MKLVMPLWIHVHCDRTSEGELMQGRSPSTCRVWLEGALKRQKLGVLIPYSPAVAAINESFIQILRTVIS